MIDSFYSALRRTAWGIETELDLGGSNQLYLDIYEDMVATRGLFRRFDVKIPHGVTGGQEAYYKWMKPVIQRLAIQTVNIIRFSPDIDEYQEAVMHTQVRGGLDEKTLIKARELVEDMAKVFNLDSNNVPINRVVNAAPMQAFERYMTKAKFVFVENMDEFYASPTPKTGGSAPYSLGADDPKFLEKVKTANIMYAYPSRA